MTTWSLNGVAKSSDCDKVNQRRVLVRLRVPTPQLALQSVLLRLSAQAPGDRLARPIVPAQCTGTHPSSWGSDRNEIAAHLPSHLAFALFCVMQTNYTL